MATHESTALQLYSERWPAARSTQISARKKGCQVGCVEWKMPWGKWNRSVLAAGTCHVRWPCGTPAMGLKPGSGTGTMVMWRGLLQGESLLRFIISTSYRDYFGGSAPFG